MEHGEKQNAGLRQRLRARLANAEEKLLQYLFFLCPVKKNKVFFINFDGKGYGCNPKYIAEEMLRQRLGYDMVWLARDPEQQFPEGIRSVRAGSARARYEIATSRVIVTNVKTDLHLVKKKSQYVIQTWHGSYSAKYLEADAQDKLLPSYVRESRKSSRQTDLFLSNSRVLSECYRSAFWCTCEILECGFPRNDVLFHREEPVLGGIRSRLGIPEGYKIMLYAPTFRDDGSFDAYNLDCEALMKELNSGEEKWKLLIRMHPNVGTCGGRFRFDDTILDATGYPDMQELILVSDALITDYSSTVFEFAATGKAVFIYAPDIGEYQHMRGLKKEFFAMPYEICTTNEALLNEIRSRTPQRTREQAAEFMKTFGGVDKGDASKRVTERIKAVISGG